jgi:hypothetical protein
MSESNAVQNSDVKANQIEAKSSEATVVLVELSPAQHQAMVKMDKINEKDSIARSVLSSRIKGMYKAYKDGAQKEIERIYDESARRGAKWPTSKAEFVRVEMASVNDLFNQL